VAGPNHSGPAFAENDNIRDTHNAKEFYKKLNSEWQ
jgi:hypothetical protein